MRRVLLRKLQWPQSRIILTASLEHRISVCQQCCEIYQDISGHAVADTFLDAEESEEEDADRGAYDYKDLAAAFDQGGFDGLSQSDTSDAASMSDVDDEGDHEAAGTGGPFQPAARGRQPKREGKG